jgi:Fe2+ transport system protein FeoA
MTLYDVPINYPGIVDQLVETGYYQIIHRLGELGFITGETVMVVARNKGAIAVRIGDSMFALNNIEASCIRVS